MLSAPIKTLMMEINCLNHFLCLQKLMVAESEDIKLNARKLAHKTNSFLSHNKLSVDNHFWLSKCKRLANARPKWPAVRAASSATFVGRANCFQPVSTRMLQRRLLFRLLPVGQ